MTKSAAKEMGRRGIRVNAIAPGFIETDMTGALTEEQKKQAAANISLKRMGKPEDIAGAALFLASDLGAYVTGQVIGVDGGLIMALATLSKGLVGVVLPGGIAILHLLFTRR